MQTTTDRQTKTAPEQRESRSPASLSSPDAGLLLGALAALKAGESVSQLAEALPETAGFIGNQALLALTEQSGGACAARTARIMRGARIRFGEEFPENTADGFEPPFSPVKTPVFDESAPVSDFSDIAALSE